MKEIFVFYIILLLNIHKMNGEKPHQLLLISMDGFRSDKFEEFLRENPNSNFAKFASEGVKAEYMVPSFPSLTFPNHITLATGLHPESHGIVANTFFDPKYNAKSVLLGSSKDLYDVKWWNQSEPIWMMAKKQGLTTSSMFWVSSDIIPRNPDIWLPYDDKYPFNQRIDNIVRYISKFKVDFNSLYFEEPDATGHTYGPDSVQYKNKIKEMDSLFGNLIDQLKNENVYDTTNIIMTSDHGMATILNTVIITNYIDPQKIDMNKTVMGVVSNVYAVPGQETYVYDTLKAIPNLNVYYKSDVPKQYSYSSNDRIGPIVVVAAEGYVLGTSATSSKGAHGFNNTIAAMRTIFMGRGPSFLKNQVLKPFQNLNVCPLICRLLDIKCNPTNGTADIFDDVLVDSSGPNNFANNNQFIFRTFIGLIFFYLPIFMVLSNLS